MNKSIEPNIADLANGWLKSYNLDYKLEQEPLNTEIDKALADYFTKNGGTGSNRPDVKILLRDKKLNDFPILIEYKGHKEKLVSLKDGRVENLTSKNEPHFQNINSYAVNGAVHYANALLHHTNYTDIIAIGMTGHKNASGDIEYEIGVYYISKRNLGVGQKVGDYSDLSFLSSEHFDDFIERIRGLSLSEEELAVIKKQREKEINASLVKLNNDIYKKETGLGENDRVYLVAASIIATLGIPNEVSPLEKSDLRSSDESGNRDGDIVLRKIKAFLNKKKIPEDKCDLIIRTLANTLTTENINKTIDGESQLKRVFSNIINDLGIYYKIGLTTDFTGMLFNEMYNWLGFSQDKLNDVVLTPYYIATLLAKLARVNKDSYVWDFATGSAGLLVSAMNEMLNDAKEKITSPDELRKKEVMIKGEQLLGLEVLPNIYILAILNMILMGDGSSNILNKNSLEFDGKYGFGDTGREFPADAFILNPPYSAEGKGMVFVEKALNMMSKGYAAVIIQSSAGSGKAKDFNIKILQNHTLLASIKMPTDLFVGKSNVQTFIYVFRVREAHHKDDMVKFIDFSDDGYQRANRRKSSNNLKNIGKANERYTELVNLVRYGKSKLCIFTESEYYENTIDPTNGADWNQSIQINTSPTIHDFQYIVSDCLAWEINDMLKTVASAHPNKIVEKAEWGEYRLGDLFDIENTLSFNKDMLNDGSGYDYVTRTSQNQGILQETGFVNQTNINQAGCWSLGLLQMDFFYRRKPWYAGQFVRKIIPKIGIDENSAIFFTVLLNKQKKELLSKLVRDIDNTFRNTKIQLPIKNNQPDYEFMERYTSAIQKIHITGVVDMLTQKQENLK